MDNVINPNLQISSPTTLPDKTTMISVNGLPSQIRVGESILLEVLMNNESALAKPQASLFLVLDNQKIPLQINEKTSLPTDLPQQISAKVTGNNTLQLILPERKNVALPPETSSDTSVVIKATNTSLPQAKLLPLSGQQITTKLMGELAIPETVQKSVNNLLPQATLSLKIEAPLNANTLPQADVIAPLRAAVQSLSQAVVENNQPQISISREQVITALQNLESQKLVATPQITDSPIKQLATPLGNVFMETPLKLPTDTRLELIIPEVKTHNPEVPLETLQKIFEQPEIAALFPRGNHHQLLGLLQNRDEAVTNLLKVFEPLSNAPQLALPILQKLPQPSVTLLSNIYSFYKGATEQDATIWLGREITTTLRSSGETGQAMLQNLQDFVTSSMRETPSWRIVEMPFFDGSQMMPLKLAVKKDEEQEDKSSEKKSKSGVRFLIETEFSKLGAFQLDGFSVAKERRLDLVIRTSKRQSEDFCSHIINLFKTSLYNVDYIGTISVNQKQSFIKTDIESPTNLQQGMFI